MPPTLTTPPTGIPEINIAFVFGEMQFSASDGWILVLALLCALVSALKLWRIGQSEDRQRRLLDALGRVPRHQRDTSRPPWYQRVGTTIAATRLIGRKAQKKLLATLVAAGVKGHGHLASLITAKVGGAATLVLIIWLLLEWRHYFVEAATVRSLILVSACILGWYCPEVALSRIAARRRIRLELGMPDALDLLVICAEAGLSIDHAIEQVGRVLHSSSPEVAEEFAATAAEMRVSAARGQALENLAQRVSLASLRGIVAALNQSIRFGTPLAASLRVLAAEMRAERLARFEERAARLPVILTLPLMAFILPSLMIVIGTPLVLRIIDMLGKSH
jgi:tight adherence protein C